MKMIGFVFVAVLAGAVAAPAAHAEGKKSDAAKIKRGEYLVRIGGCNECHTPWVFNKDFGHPVPDVSRMLSGHPAAGPDPASKYDPNGHDIVIIGPDFTSFRLPFGLVYAPNLTPDKDTGIGSWSESMFVKALRTGRHLGEKSARVILPPMPWENLAGVADEDLKSIFAFLQSLPPIKNAVPDPKVPPPVLDGMSKALEKQMAVMEAQKGKAKP